LNRRDAEKKRASKRDGVHPSFYYIIRISITFIAKLAAKAAKAAKKRAVGFWLLAISSRCREQFVGHVVFVVPREASHSSVEPPIGAFMSVKPQKLQKPQKQGVSISQHSSHSSISQ